MALFVSSEQQSFANFTHAYNIAGELLYSQQSIALIEAFEVDCQLPEGVTDGFEITTELFDVDSARLIYQGEGSFSGGMKQVSVWERGHIQLLRVGANNFSLTNFVTGHIRLLGCYQTDQLESAEILLGPPLLTLLATKSVFCLHAGAVATEYGAAVFIGESGRGKSTLSQSVAGSHWQRLGDDIMPVSLSEDNVFLIPRFPQLKRKLQHLSYTLESLVAIFRLLEPATHQQVECQLTQGSEALITLSRHTAASRVFNERLLKENMVFNRNVLNKIPIYNLSYPRDFNCLDHVRDTVSKVLIKHSGQIDR